MSNALKLELAKGRGVLTPAGDAALLDTEGVSDLLLSSVELYYIDCSHIWA